MATEPEVNMHALKIEQAVRDAAPGRQRTAKFMGWRPDLPDGRDFMAVERLDLPKLYTGLPVAAEDKRVHHQPVFDQGQTGSCTGQSVSALHAIERNVSPRSAMFTYWHARDLIGETGLDEGAYIRDAIKVTNIEGVPRDDLWPQLPALLFKAPDVKAEVDAEKRRIFNYYRLDADLDYASVDRAAVYRSCLASGHCFVIGFTVYGNFWSAGYNGGLASMPAGQPDGGHAVLVYGYDDKFTESKKGIELMKRGLTVPQSVYKVRNSWGSEWGDSGDFYMPTAYLENPNLADDAWTLRRK